jgi:cytochrome c oxidase subunit IV
MSTRGHVLPVRVYLTVFAALLVGTALTAWVATLDLGRWNDAAALIIAGTKAALVMLYFMHVRYSSRLVWVFSVAGFGGLMLLFVLVLADYETRVVVAGWG